MLALLRLAGARERADGPREGGGECGGCAGRCTCLVNKHLEAAGSGVGAGVQVYTALQVCCWLVVVAKAVRVSGVAASRGGAVSSCSTGEE